MTRVIAALDNTDRAGPVLAFARALAPVLGAHVEAVHVEADGVHPEAVAAAEDAGVPLRTLRGPPAERLQAEAESQDVAAVVLGRSTRPAGGVVGEIAAELLTTISSPVAVVPADAVHPGRLSRALVPLEGTRSSSLAPRRMIGLARDAGIHILLLHVFDEASLPAFTDQPQHETEGWAREFLTRYSPCPPKDVQLEVRVGRPEDHVCAVASELDADLIALGWSQELAPGRAQVVRAALDHAKLPVLLVPVVTLEKDAAEQARLLVSVASTGGSTQVEDSRGHTIERKLD